MTTNRRVLLSGAASLALFTPSFAQDAKPDPKLLSEASSLGEMELGPKDAKVTMIEYASASCPHCREFYETVFVQFRKDYIDTGKVHFIFREYPHNDPALAAFMVARCAPKEKFFSLIDVYFTTQDKWVPDPLNGLKNIALQAGLTEDQFTACLKNEPVAKAIFEVRQRGEKLGVNSIPTIYINGELYSGDRTMAAIKAKIDPLLG
jgi:protein-disulfide isomerase